VRLPDPPLLIVTDRHQATRPLEHILDGAFAAGCRWASVREKDLPGEQQIVLARRLLPLARDWGARLTLHGSPVLARDADLDGVHLPAGANAAAARQMLGRHALIGISIHKVEEAAKLDPHIVDYAIAGPAYATPSKPQHGPILGMVGIQKIADATKVPIIAIGGITAGAVPEMHVGGAVGVAVMGGIMRADDPCRVVTELVAALRPGPF
jgi:thiamine-phosphate pyrophosphorylase